MSWLLLDDAFTDHPKVVGLSLEARGVWITGLVYSGRRLTDGFIPSPIIKREGNGVDSAVQELISAGLWELTENGYLIHDYLDYNPSKEEVLLKRQARSISGRAGGLASAEARAQAGTQRFSNESSTNVEAKFNPIPIPLTHKDLKPISCAEFDAFWLDYPHKVNKKGALASWHRLNKADQKLATEGLAKWLPFYATRDQEFIPHPSTWLNQRRWESDPPQKVKSITQSRVYNTEGTM